MQRLIRAPSGPQQRLRALLRRSRGLQRLMQSVRARYDERAYLRLRERYAASGRAWGPIRDELDRHRDLLARGWPGPRSRRSSPEDVRLFVVTGELGTTPAMANSLTRSFDVEMFDYVPYLPTYPRVGPWRDELQRDLLKRFRAAHETRPIDVALLYVTHFECEPETLVAIRSMGVPAVVLCGDDKHSFEATPGLPSGQRGLIGAANLHLTNSRECMRWYAAEGAASYYVAWAADPYLFSPLEMQKDIAVSFVGGWYGARRELISLLRRYGIEAQCWGPQTESGAIPREELNRVFNRTRINLGFGGVGATGSVTCLKARDFEIPMSGNLYLTSYDHELANLYAVGREIMCYRNEIDCVEQIRFLLGQPDEFLAKIGRAARERSSREHTWAHRFNELFRWMGILAQPRDAANS